MIEFKDLFTIQYARHDGIDFEKKIAISIKFFLKCLMEKETDKFLNVGTFTKSLYTKINLSKIRTYTSAYQQKNSVNQ